MLRGNKIVGPNENLQSRKARAEDALNRAYELLDANAQKIRRNKAKLGALPKDSPEYDDVLAALYSLEANRKNIESQIRDLEELIKELNSEIENSK